MAIWDTSVASRLHPEDPLLDFVIEAARTAVPVSVAATTVAEISYGLQARASDPRFVELLDWFTELFAGGIIEVRPFTRSAAVVAGRVRAESPVSPASARGDNRSKPERRVAWVADIQIAAAAWVAGEPVVTADRGHFDLLSASIEALYPGDGGLEIQAPPS